MFMGKSAVRSKAFFGVTAALVVAAMLQAASASAGDTVYYYSSDTVHSEVVVTDQNRNVVERTYYAPYGQVLNRDLRDGPGYTGHEEDPETGLVYMQQRYYDPDSGRFLSVDPVGVDPTNVGNFNRYEYAEDNPYRYADPDGRYTCSGSKTDCEAVATFAMTSIVAKMYSSPKSSEYNSIGRAVSALGFPGEENGVTVTAKTLSGNERGNAAQGGNISIDVAKIRSFGAVLKETGRDSNKTTAEVQNAVGAGVLTHEATHEVDYRNPAIGYPHSEAADRALEVRGYSVEKAVGNALGMDEIGLSTQHEFDTHVQKSVNTFCSDPRNGCQ